MGILHSGIFGGFSKKAGPLIGRRGQGKDIITGLYHKRDRLASATEKQQQEKFALLNKWLNLCKPVIKTGFKDFCKTRTALNAAFSANYPHIFVETENGPAINYTRFIYSKGIIQPPAGLKAEKVAGGLLFQWATTLQNQYCRYHDPATFAIVNVTRQMFLTETGTAKRGDNSYLFALPEAFADDELVCYMNFSSHDRKLTGRNVCGGHIF